MQLRYFLPVLVIASSTAEPQAATRLDAYVAPLVRDHEFSGNILIRQHGRDVAERSYGMANREFGVANRPDTRFLIGSISKQFTAAAILLLEQQGKLSTSDHLDKFVSGFPSGDVITLAQMLAHTSGISRDLANASDATVAHTGSELVEIIKHQPLVAPPGTKAAYSNNAYKILAYVVERASGEPYGTFLERSFFRPFGMTNTGDYASLTLVPRLASGYAPGFGPDGFGPSPHLDISNSRGAASIYSTTRDLATWCERFLVKGEVYPLVRNKMLAGEGVGVGVTVRDGHRVISHDGVYQGYTAYLATYPDDELTIVYLGNTETAASVSALQSALDIIARGGTVTPAPSVARGGSVPLASIEDYVGNYDFFPGLRATIKRQGSDLLLGVGEGDYPLEWREKDRMFFRLKHADVRFTRDSAGKVISLDWSEAGQTFPAKRSPAGG
jgi:CubicO group peptidase (beta-lactamase class C family)